MRNLFFTLLCIVYTSAATAQSYIPLLQEGKKWIVNMPTMIPLLAGAYSSYATYELREPRLLNDSLYYEVYRTIDYHADTIWYAGKAHLMNVDLISVYESDCGERAVGFLFEKDQRVFYKPTETAPALLLYDFSLAENIFIPWANSHYNCLLALHYWGKQNINGIPRRLWLTKTIEAGEEATSNLLDFTVEEELLTQHPEELTQGYIPAWIEGIGSTAGLLAPAQLNVPGNMSHALVCVMQGEEILFGEIPTAIKTSAASAPASTRYDLSGRSLSKRPAHGVYVENGRKRVKI